MLTMFVTFPLTEIFFGEVQDFPNIVLPFRMRISVKPCDCNESIPHLEHCIPSSRLQTT